MVCAALALGAPFVILRRLIQQPEIDFRTVAGALCIYLLAGLLFARHLRVDERVAEALLRAAGRGRQRRLRVLQLRHPDDGRLRRSTSRTNLGHISSIFESLFGQLYLVSVVALLVANIGRPRRFKAS